MVALTHLLDTDICIELMRKRDDSVLRRLRRSPDVGISTVSVSELAYAARRSADPARGIRALDELLAIATVLPFDTDAATSAGKVRAELADRGTPIGPFDLLIAGQALAAGLTLASRNVREFRRARGLRVEKW